MKVTAKQDSARLVALASLEPGEVALKMSNGFGGRAAPSHGRGAQHLIIRLSISQSMGLEAEKGEVLVANLETGACWLANGKQPVIRVAGEVTYEVQP